MRTHNTLTDLLAHFSVEHHRWLLVETDFRTFAEFNKDFLSENKLNNHSENTLKPRCKHLLKLRSRLPHVSGWFFCNKCKTPFNVLTRSKHCL